MTRHYTLQSSGPSPRRSIDYEQELNPQQYAAVAAPPGPALVIAGAGSGKTRTLTYRVAWLLDNGIDPGSILLLTFTNKAAKEMLERVEHLVPVDTTRLWGGTFHSIGNRLLRRHAERVGLQANFSIMDREDQKDLVGAVIAESDIDPKALRFPKPEVLSDIFSLVVNTETSLRDLLETRYPYFEHLGDAISTIRRNYEAKKLATNSADFDDLLVKAHALLAENEDLLESYQRQFEFVLVDEYQDTNHIQAQLIAKLAQPQDNLTVVGDDAQSIYSWRGADFQNILDFPERYPSAQVFKIETNYRSVPEILSLANHAIRANRQQFRKDLAAERGGREVLPALVPLNDPSTQASFVAQRILELRDESYELEEIAVLYRSHYQSMEIQMELTNRGIPFVITSGLRFFEQAHVKDVAAFMKFAVNRRDEVAFRRMVRMLPGIGARTAEKLWSQWLRVESAIGEEALTSFSESLLDFKVPAKGRKAWEQLVYTLDELLDGEGGVRAAPEMMASVIEGVYDDYLRSKFSNYESRRQDLQQLELYGARFATVDEFLSQLSLLAGTDTASGPGGEPDSEAVVLSSVHQAKGLEWRAVFVVWLAEGMFPNSRVLEHDDEAESGLEEERRLFYVAVTRAKDELYLTYPLIWQNAHSGQVIQRPSRFLDELPEECLEAWEVGRGW